MNRVEIKLKIGILLILILIFGIISLIIGLSDTLFMEEKVCYITIGIVLIIISLVGFTNFKKIKFG